MTRIWTSKQESLPFIGEKVECLHRDGKTSWQNFKGKFPNYITAWRY